MEQRQRPWVKPMGLALAPPRKGKHHHFQLLQFSFLSHGTEWHAWGGWTISQNRYLLQARLFIHIGESQLNVTQRGWECGSTEILGSFSQLPGTLLHSKSAVKVVSGMCMDSAYRYTAWGRGKFTVKLVPEDTCGQQLHADAPRCICTRLSFPIAEKNILTFTA